MKYVAKIIDVEGVDTIATVHRTRNETPVADGFVDITGLDPRPGDGWTMTGPGEFLPPVPVEQSPRVDRLTVLIRKVDNLAAALEAAGVI